MPRLGNGYGFGGFPSEAFRFYELLGAENTKAFWTQHKHEYDQFVKAPFEALAASVAGEFGPLHVFRPNRDVRFSKDKTPYKTHCGAVTEGEGGEAYYLQISSSGLMVASGYYGFAADQLERYRGAVDSKAGNELDRLLDSYRRTALRNRRQRVEVRTPRLCEGPFARPSPAAQRRLRVEVLHRREVDPHSEGTRADRDDLARHGSVAQVAQPQRGSEHPTARRMVKREASTG